MKASEVEVGQTVRIKQRSSWHRAIVVDARPYWTDKQSRYPQLSSRRTNGVAVAKKSGAWWFPEVVHLSKVVTDEEYTKRRDEQRAASLDEWRKAEETQDKNEALRDRFRQLGIEAYGSTDGDLISVGLKDAEDIVATLEHAIEAVRAERRATRERSV